MHQQQKLNSRMSVWCTNNNNNTNSNRPKRIVRHRRMARRIVTCCVVGTVTFYSTHFLCFLCWACCFVSLFSRVFDLLVLPSFQCIDATALEWLKPNKARTHRKHTINEVGTLTFSRSQSHSSFFNGVFLSRLVFGSLLHTLYFTTSWKATRGACLHVVMMGFWNATCQ